MALLPQDASATRTATEPIDQLKLGISGYIAEMTKDLKGLAANADFEFLAYLLSVAEEEARGMHRTMRARAATTPPPADLYPLPEDAP
jgi:hypothetical protein